MSDAVIATNIRVTEERTDPKTGEVYLIERAPFLVDDGNDGWVAEDVVEIEGTRHMPEPQPKSDVEKLMDVIVGAKDLATLKADVAKLDLTADAVAAEVAVR